MNELSNLEKIHESAREIVEPYAKSLIELLGANVYSIAIFGSGISQEFIPKKSNINLLVVCEEVNLAELKKCFKLVLKGRKKGIIAPLFLTRTHMETSSDVFPIEFLDMADFHQTIYGEDVFTNLQIGTEHLRLEVEEQLKGKLIRLRQAYLEVGAEYKAIAGILKDSITSLVPVFRSMLRLKEKTAALSKSEVIKSVSEEFGAEADVLLKVLDIKTGKIKLQKEEIGDFFGKYIAEIEKLAIAVDKMGK